jgi:hypothetical protein
VRHEGGDVNDLQLKEGDHGLYGTLTGDLPEGLAILFMPSLAALLTLAAAAVALGQENDAERLVYVGNVYKHHFVVARKFLALAEKYPDDPVAFDALRQAVWQVNNTPWPVEMVGEEAARPRAFELLQRDHLKSDKLGPLCQRIFYGFCKEYETFTVQFPGPLSTNAAHSLVSALPPLAAAGLAGAEPSLGLAFSNAIRPRGPARSGMRSGWR